MNEQIEEQKNIEFFKNAMDKLSVNELLLLNF